MTQQTPDKTLMCPVCQWRFKVSPALGDYEFINCPSCGLRMRVIQGAARG